jgi:hypothetical protein
MTARAASRSPMMWGAAHKLAGQLSHAAHHDLLTDLHVAHRYRTAQRSRVRYALNTRAIPPKTVMAS